MKIIIADDHPLIAEGVSANLKTMAQAEIVYMAHNGQEVLDYLEDHEADLVLMDLEMPELNGLDCARKMRVHFPEVRVIILSMYEEPELISQFKELGIKGYLLKTSPMEEIQQAIQDVMDGGSHYSEEIMKKVGQESFSNVSPVPSFQTSSLANRLSKRELEIIPLFSKGYTNAQIAEMLFLSARTVETHRSNIFKKTKTKNIAELIRFAFKNGLI